MEKNELLEIIDEHSEEVFFDMLNLPHQKRGNITWVLCPKHNDKHFGNCKTFKKGLFCFACQSYIRPVDAVMEVYNESFYDALSDTAKFLGVNFCERDKEKHKISKTIEITRDKNFHLLGLEGVKQSKLLVPVNISFHKPEEGEFKDISTLSEEGDWDRQYLIYETDRFSWQDLDEEERLDILKKRLDVCIEDTKLRIQKTKKRDVQKMERENLYALYGLQEKLEE